MRSHMDETIMALLICPRCKQRCLNPNDNGDSSLYGSRHVICVPCFFEEEREIDTLGTNNLPEVLAKYGPSNESAVDAETRHY